MTISDLAHDHTRAHGRVRAWRDPTILTPAERLLMIQLATRADITSAARELRVSSKSAKNRLDTIRDKLGVRTNAEAIAIWTRSHAR